MSTESRSLVIYHGPHCNDGFTAAWVAWIGINSPENVMLYPMGYGEKNEDELIEFLADQNTIHTYSYIYVLDFSLREEIIEQVMKLTGYASLTILDHHKSAFNMYFPENERTPGEVRYKKLHNGRVNIQLDNGRSGAAIAWNYFFPATETPPLVKYVQDRDLWRFDYPETQAIHKYLADTPKTIDDWNQIHGMLCHKSVMAEIVNEGQHLLDIYNEEVSDIVSAATVCTIKGERGLMVECSGEYASDVGNILAERSGTYGMTFYELEDAETLKVSLRSKGDYDVEVMAKQFGGGGHKNASGFILSLEDVMAEFVEQVEQVESEQEGEEI